MGNMSDPIFIDLEDMEMNATEIERRDLRITREVSIHFKLTRI